MKRYICFRPEEHVCEHETGAYVLFADAQAAIEAREEIAENLRGEIRDISAESAVLFADAQAAIEAREEIAENLRGEIRDISAESAKFEIQATQLRAENESLEILLKNLRVEINALREG